MTVSIKTTRFGEIEVQENQLLFFKGGLIGFPEQKEFALIEKKSDSPFIWLQSTKDADVAFIVADPDHINPEYVFVPTNSELTEVELQSVDGADIYVIITVPEDPHEMSANLKAPILVNPKTRAAKQIILNQGHITTRHYLIKDPEEAVSDKGTDKVSNLEMVKPFKDMNL